MSQGAASVFPLGIWLSKVHKERSTQGRRWPPVEARNSRAPERHKEKPERNRNNINRAAIWLF